MWSPQARLRLAAHPLAGGAFRSGARGLDFVLGPASGKQLHRPGAVEFPDAQLFVEAYKTFEDIGSAGEIGKAHRPVAEDAPIEARAAVQHIDIAVTPVGDDAGQNLVDRALFAFERL